MKEVVDIQIKDKCIKFAEWLRINFQNSPEEFDNYWYDINYTIHNIERKNYTTSELWEYFNVINNTI